MLPTFLAAAGDPNVKDNLLKGVTSMKRSYKVHLDGYNLLPYFKGDTKDWPREEFFYWTDDGNVAGLRYNNWKIVFMEQRSHGFDVWQEPFVTLRMPKLFNLRTDPFERADHEGMGYGYWRINRAYVLAPAQAYVGKYLESFKDFPPRQKPGSFNLGDAMAKMTEGTPNN
jgi:arylsulfatase